MKLFSNWKTNKNFDMCIVCDCGPEAGNILKGTKRLDCSNCQLLEKIPPIEGLKILNFSNCPLLTKIPLIHGLETLWCGRSSIVEIPMISSLLELTITNCPLLEKIHPSLRPGGSLKGLKILRIFDCPLLTELPIIDGLHTLEICRCRSLIEIPSIYLHTYQKKDGIHRLGVWDCPWLKETGYLDYNKNIVSLVTLQKFCRKNLKFFRFKRWLKSHDFVSWFYAPENFGGYKTKLRMEVSMLNLSTEI